MAPPPETSPSPDSSNSSPPPKKSPPPSSQPPPPKKSPPPSSQPPPPKKSPPPSSQPPPPKKSPPPSSQPPPPKKSPPPPSSSPPPPKKSPPPPSSSSPPPPPPKKSPPPPPSPSPPPPPSSPPPKRKGGGASPPPPPSAFAPPPHHALHHHSHKSPIHKTHHKSERSDTSNQALIIGPAIAIFLFVALLTICVICVKKKKRKKMAVYYMTPPPGPSGGGVDYYKNQPMASPHEYVVVGVGSNLSTPPPAHMPLAFSTANFTYTELSVATGGFSQANVLGEGGFGYVYKGSLPNGQEVAVKCLKSGSTQGEREFQAEVEIISRVHHRHLVSLVGYCIADTQRMLVYEHVPNKTLHFHLHGRGVSLMKWETRIRIALGSAKGLAYLHEDCEPRIIHRDIKSSNILLDHNYEAKVADFGLAKLASGDDTHISTRVMGTFGYLAPEYASSGKLTEKSDVFSFGVMLLELLTGRKPIDPTNNYTEDSLVEWAGPLLVEALEDRNYDELVDRRLEGNYDPNEVARMVSCAAASIRHSARRRPKMSHIVRALEGNASLDTLNDDLKQQRVGSTLSFHPSPEASTSVVYDTRAYNEDMRKFREMVISSQELTKGE